jgi:hypothetical protein
MYIRYNVDDLWVCSVYSVCITDGVNHHTDSTCTVHTFTHKNSQSLPRLYFIVSYTA